MMWPPAPMIKPIPRERWSVKSQHNTLCDEPCCELRRVAAVAHHVTTIDELLEALAQSHVFYMNPVR